MCNPIAYDVLFICKQIVCLLLATIKVNPIFNRCHLRRWNDRSGDKESENYSSLQGTGFTLLHRIKGFRITACNKNSNIKGSSRRKYCVSDQYIHNGSRSAYNVCVRKIIHVLPAEFERKIHVVCMFSRVFLNSFGISSLFSCTEGFINKLQRSYVNIFAREVYRHLGTSRKFQNVTVDQFYIVKLLLMLFKENRRI